MRSNRSWAVGEWVFHRVTNHGFSGELADVPLFGYETQGDLGAFGKPKLGELYLTLEHAMAAAIAEKHTGRRGAGGTGVGTAADWFMKMIGADQPTRQELIDKAASDSMVIGIAEDSGITRGDGAVVAKAVIDALELGRKV